MTLISAGDHTYYVDLVIFDKDGTLFDFSAMWKRIFLRQVEIVAGTAGECPDLEKDLLAAMGVDHVEDAIDPLGPLALATYDEILIIMAGVLYRHGRPWDEALRAAIVATDRGNWPPMEELIQPVGDVVALFRRLNGAGLHIGVVTTDDRAMTKTMLEMAGLWPLVDAMVCADDGFALKPAPDGILAVCRQLGVAPGRAMMVGDSPTDMLAAQAAGVDVRVGVLTGVSRRSDLTPAATVVLSSIQELSLLPGD